jgi:hypothetical protein
VRGSAYAKAKADAMRGSAYAKAKADAMRRSAYAKAKADAMRGPSVALRAMVAYAKASATGHGCDEM